MWSQEYEHIQVMGQKKCIEKANNLDSMDIINSPYFNRHKLKIKAKV